MLRKLGRLCVIGLEARTSVPHMVRSHTICKPSQIDIVIQTFIHQQLVEGAHPHIIPVMGSSNAVLVEATRGGQHAVVGADVSGDLSRTFHVRAHVNIRCKSTARDRAHETASWAARQT